MSNTVSLKNRESNYIIHPKKFALWLFLITITMLFAAFTSAMVVRKADGNWQQISLPSAFILSTILAVLSSAGMQYAYYSAKKDNIFNVRTSLFITLVLGLGFLVSQYIGFLQLIQNKIYIVGNPSGSFFYVITILHGLHVLGGVILLSFTILQAYRWKIHSRNLLRINLCTTYWHFLAALWVYLFAILTIFLKN